MPTLHKIKSLPQNRAHGRSWFSIQAKSEEESDLLIYDYIGWGGVTAADFAKQLQAIKATRINVRLNTPGGDVFDGLAIYNSLRGHGAKIGVKIEGLAASIGSIIAMAGETIAMGGGAFLMIHSPWALVVGNAEDMRGMADTLDRIGASLADIYATRPGISQEQAQEWMDGETWFNGDEAVAAGLADTVTGDGEGGAKARFDLSAYQHVPALLLRPESGATLSADEQERVAKMKRRVALIERGEFSAR